MNPLASESPQIFRPPSFGSVFLRGLMTALAMASVPLTAMAAPNSVNPDTFFKPASPIPETLRDDQVYPVGRMFPFSFFSVGGGTEEKVNAIYPDEKIQKEFAHYKTLEIPIFGPQYELKDRSLADAEKYDLKVVYTLGLPMDFHNRDPKKKTAAPTSEEIFEQISQQVKAVADNPHVAFWYLQPEELRPWRKGEMAYLEAASKAVHASDPLKRPLWIYDPAHANSKRMASIAPWVDYLGKGMYPNYASQKESRIWCRWSIEQEVDAIKQAGAKSLPLAVPEMFQQPEKGEEGKIPAWVRHDVFSSLIAGAKGVMVFSARRRPNFTAYDAYFNAYAEVAEWLLGPKKLGQIFLFGEARHDLMIDVTSGPAEVELLYPSGGLKEAIKYPSVSFLDVAYGKDRYLFVVNSANEPVTAMVGGMPYNAVKAENLLDGSAAFDVGEGEFELELEPLQVKAIHLSRR